MAIGTALAIGLGASAIGGVLSSRSQSKAAGKAADVSAQVAQQNNALAREIYGKNEGYLNPYVQRGNKAGDQINALLGLGGPEPAQIPGYAPQQGYTGIPRYQNDLYMSGAYRDRFNAGFGGQYFNQYFQPQPQAAPAPTTPAVNPQDAAEAAFQKFRDSTGYQFRLGEGMNALNTGFAGNGTLRSGAAAKSALKYGQDYGSNEFGNYVGLLSNQQGVGLSGGSALAGVGQNYVNSVSANNNSNGSAQANALLVKGQNNPFASLLGGLGGGLISSFG